MNNYSAVFDDLDSLDEKQIMNVMGHMDYMAFRENDDLLSLESMRESRAKGNHIWHYKCLFDEFEEDNDSHKVYEQFIAKEKEWLEKDEPESRVYKYSSEMLDQAEYCGPKPAKKNEEAEDDSDYAYNSKWLQDECLEDQLPL